MILSLWKKIYEFLHYGSESKKPSQSQKLSDGLTKPQLRREPWYCCICRSPIYHPLPPKKYLWLWLHTYHTFTSKASLNPAAKKIWYDTYVSNFWQAPSTFAHAEARSELQKVVLPKLGLARRSPVSQTTSPRIRLDSIRKTFFRVSPHSCM